MAVAFVSYMFTWKADQSILPLSWTEIHNQGEEVQNWAQKNGIEGQASLEERMGCGTGACLSCVCKIKVETEAGWEYQKTCTIGPVFALNEVIFDE